MQVKQAIQTLIKQLTDASIQSACLTIEQDGIEYEVIVREKVKIPNATTLKAMRDIRDGNGEKFNLEDL